MDLLQEIPGSVSLATLTCIHTQRDWGRAAADGWCY